MCFSAAASFTTSIVLGTAGATCLIKTKEKKDLFLASIPFLFALQQLAEGFVWLYPAHGTLTLIFSYAFLFFAFLLWPFYIPLVAWSNEVNQKHKRILLYVIGFGLMSSLYLLAALLTRPLVIEIIGHSIHYGISVPFQVQGTILYILVTVGSLLLSTHTFLRRFGLATLFGAIVAFTIYHQAFTSVWCFFSAVFSLIIVLHFFLKTHKNKPRRK